MHHHLGESVRMQWSVMESLIQIPLGLPGKAKRLLISKLIRCWNRTVCNPRLYVLIFFCNKNITPTFLLNGHVGRQGLKLGQNVFHKIQCYMFLHQKHMYTTYVFFAEMQIEISEYASVVIKMHQCADMSGGRPLYLHLSLYRHIYILWYLYGGKYSIFPPSPSPYSHKNSAGKNIDEFDDCPKCHSQQIPAFEFHNLSRKTKMLRWVERLLTVELHHLFSKWHTKALFCTTYNRFNILFED